MATDYSWGVIGTSPSATQFITSLQRGGRHIAGVAGKSFAQAIAFATQNSIMQAMLTPQQLITNQQIDAVYFDEDFSEECWLIQMAMQAGKHILFNQMAADNVSRLAYLKQQAQNAGIQVAVLNPLLTMPLVEKVAGLLENETVQKLTMYIAPGQDPRRYTDIFCSWLSSLLPHARLALAKAGQFLFEGDGVEASIKESTEPDLIEKLSVQTDRNVYLLDSALVPLTLKINGEEPEVVGKSKLAQLYFIEEFEKQAGESYQLLEKQELVMAHIRQLAE